MLSARHSVSQMSSWGWLQHLVVWGTLAVAQLLLPRALYLVSVPHGVLVLLPSHENPAGQLEHGRPPPAEPKPILQADATQCVRG